MTAKPKRIVQISDIHLFADKKTELLGVNTYQSFQALLDLVKSAATQPDIILLTGDCSQDHSQKAYEYIAEAFDALAIPVYYVPGNHDDLQFMQLTLPSATIFDTKHILLESFQLILLNSQKEKAVEGYLPRAQLDFLEECLKKHPTHHAILAFHHQPVPIGATWLDRIGLQNADELWEILAQYPNTHTILFGHIHQEFETTKNGINCFSTPSTCIQFKRNSPEFALDELPPAYRWIDLYSDGSLKTGVCRAAEYVGVFDAEAKGY